MAMKLYSPEEAAKVMGVDAATVRAWLRDGKLKGSKLGGRIWRISEDAITDFFNTGIEGKAKKTQAEALEAWQGTLRAADEALRLEGASFEHRQNIKAMQQYFANKASKAEAGGEEI